MKLTQAEIRRRQLAASLPQLFQNMHMTRGVSGIGKLVARIPSHLQTSTCLSHAPLQLLPFIKMANRKLSSNRLGMLAALRTIYEHDRVPRGSWSTRC